MSLRRRFRHAPRTAQEPDQLPLRACRRLSGAAFTTWLVAARSQTLVTGGHSLTTFRPTEILERRFCKLCGSHVHAADRRLPDVYGFPAGLFEGSAIELPSHDYFIKHKALVQSVIECAIGRHPSTGQQTAAPQPPHGVAWPFQMLQRIAPILLAATLSACAAPTALESAYNRGVAAYKARNYATAREHWSRAVELGDLSALNNLGYLLYYGMGGTEDRPGAIALWRQAATRGHAEAQWHLGHAYEDGTAVPGNVVEAYAWYRCAIASAQATTSDDETAALVAEDARKSLAKLLPKLSSEQISTAQTWANRYIASYARKMGV